MSRIKRLKVSGIKGSQVDIQLGGVNVILGANGEGKTALQESIMLAFAGHVPRLGPKKTRKLMSEASMSVLVELDSGERASGEWRMKGGKVSETLNTLAGIPPVALDARVYLGLTENQRTDFIFRQLDLAALGFGDEAIVAELKGLKLEEHTAEAEVGLRELTAEVEKLADKRAKTGQPLQEWLADIYEFLRKRKTEQEAVVRQMRASLDAAAQLRAGEGVASLRPGVERERADCQTRADELRAKLNDVQQRIKAATEAAALVERLEGEMEVFDAETAEAKLAELRRKADVLRQEASAYIFRTPKATGRRHEAEMKREGIAREAARLRREQADADSKLGPLLKAVACPTCGACGTDWRMLVETQHNDAKAIRQQMLDKLDGELAAVNSEHSAASEDERACLEADAANAAKLKTAAQLEVEARRVESEIAVFTQKATKLLAARDGVKSPEMLADWRAEEGRLSGEAGRNREEWTRLDQELLRATAARQDAKRREEATAAALKHEIASKLAKLAGEKVVELQEKLVAKAIGSVLAKAEVVTAGIIGSPLVWREGEIGRIRNGVFVSLDTFNGADERLALAGLQIALAPESKVKLVMLDELGTLDAANKRKLIRAMLRAVDAGVIDQFIGFDVDSNETTYPPDEERLTIIPAAGKNFRA